ncbi:MAG TPA: hypothetical protein PLW35_09180, partial [Verrucomicrobiota bacterium]|nr:hypothetical protein [Verrucomicrobiota bacterium]
HWDQRALPCDGVAGDISQPGVTEGMGGVQEPGGVARQATLVPATPGWQICGPVNLTGLKTRVYLGERGRVSFPC